MGAERRERKHPFVSLQSSSSFKVEKKKGNEKVEREARGEDVSLPPHYSARCKLPVAASLAPALFSPLASAPQFLTTFFPAGNVNQDTFRFLKKKKRKI